MAKQPRIQLTHITLIMVSTRRLCSLVIIVVLVIQGYQSVTTNVNDHVVLKRVRRIIRGHLAAPGQVTSARWVRIESEALAISAALPSLDQQQWRSLLRWGVDS